MEDFETSAIGSVVAKALGDQKSDGTDKCCVAGHCHGCASVSIPQPVDLAVMIELTPTQLFPPQSAVVDHSPGIDLPPPKHRT